LLLASGLSLYFLVSAILGAIYNFSPVPFWDMWDGYLDFYLRLNGSNWSVWWEQNNEHRIILAKILFWLDFKLFGGGIVFLIICNYLLAFLAATMFAVILKAGIGNERFTRAHLIITAAVAALSLSWVQSENFLIGFQSQFFLAQSLPLVALYLLSRSADPVPGKNLTFALAAVSGVACAGTMANGVLALPCMTLVALVSKFSCRKILILTGLAIAIAILYFHGYHTPAQHGSPWFAIKDKTIEVLLFTLTYLGSPYFYAAKGSLLAAQLAGAILLLALFLFVVRVLSTRNYSALLFSLLGYEIYLVTTALITASGRTIFGIEYAVSSRYTTPALMAWCAMFVMLAIYYRGRPTIVYGVGVVALSLALSLLSRQSLALDRYNDYNFERLIAALALEMGVKDEPQILNSYYSVEHGLSLANQARHLQISIFANPLLVGTREKIGALYGQKSLPPCIGFIDNATPLSMDPRYLRISGWVYRPDTDTVPRKIMIVDEGGHIVGAALSGQQRSDIASSTKLVGFKGYIQVFDGSEHLMLVGSAPDCQLPLAASLPIAGKAG
jgi:hypothetical protein